MKKQDRLQAEFGISGKDYHIGFTITTEAKDDPNFERKARKALKEVLARFEDELTRIKNKALLNARF